MKPAVKIALIVAVAAVVYLMVDYLAYRQAIDYGTKKPEGIFKAV